MRHSETIGHNRILRLLGEGGIGMVHEHGSLMVVELEEIHLGAKSAIRTNGQQVFHKPVIRPLAEDVDRFA